MKNINWKKYAGAAMAAAMIPALVAPIATEAASSETVDLKNQGYRIVNAHGIDPDGVAFFYYDDIGRKLMDINLAGGPLADTLNVILDNRNKNKEDGFWDRDVVNVDGAISSGSYPYLPNDWPEYDYKTEKTYYTLNIGYNGKTYSIPYRIKPGSAKTVESGVYMIKEKSSGMYLTPKTIDSQPYPYLTVEKDHFEDAQKWVVTKTGENGVYTIKNKKSGMYLDVAGSSLDSNVKIIQHPENKHENQEWKLVAIGNDIYNIRSVISGLNLDLAQHLESHGFLNSQWIQPIIQYTPHNGENQQFELIKVN